jgi:hypothetical protein
VTSRSNQGRLFQATVTQRIIERFRDWSSVHIVDSRGRVITSVSDIRYSRDGGEDLFVEIRADLPEPVQKAVETRLRKIGATERFW